ncbi:DUF484 family protein [Aestuariibius insulae]|uniref:DUF484 family protein n=1 Tax=Aestuariibius insulae TaxID=2058287 RepID=UPI00345E31D4
MSTTHSATLETSLRERILADPALLLDDPDVMRALVDTKADEMGGNIVDLRGVAMERLEHRLDRLEEAHKSVIAAAYDNLAGTNQVHRAILGLLSATTFSEFLEDLGGDVKEILRVNAIRLVLEEDTLQDPDFTDKSSVLLRSDAGFVKGYIGQGRDAPLRPVTLRKLAPRAGGLFGDEGPHQRSEACLKLDFGGDRRPGLLALASEDESRFIPQQGTDLLEFFGGVVERSVRRWMI